jgi:hypothetical protein
MDIWIRISIIAIAKRSDDRKRYDIKDLRRNSRYSHRPPGDVLHRRHIYKEGFINRMNLDNLLFMRLGYHLILVAYASLKNPRPKPEGSGRASRSSLLVSTSVTERTWAHIHKKEQKRAIAPVEDQVAGGTGRNEGGAA